MMSVPQSAVMARLLRGGVAVAAALSLAWVGLGACWCPERTAAASDHCCCGADEAKPHVSTFVASSCGGPCVAAPLPAPAAEAAAPSDAPLPAVVAVAVVGLVATARLAAAPPTDGAPSFASASYLRTVLRI